MMETPVPESPRSGTVRLVMVGDVVGKPGLRITCQAIPWLRSVVKASAIIVNAENAADGSGLRCKDYRRLCDAGVDGVTLGDHVYRKREIIDVLESESNIVRPANLPPGAPGKHHAILELPEGIRLAIVCLQGRVFMKPVDCPFRALDAVLETIPSDVPLRLVDFHAEATSDMQLMGRYGDGRVTAVLGTHTHVATADEQILPGGTAFQCDIGMTGPFESILGRKIDAVLEATLHALPTPFQVAAGDVRLNATWIDADLLSGKCTNLGRINVTENTLEKYNLDAEAAKRVL